MKPLLLMLPVCLFTGYAAHTQQLNIGIKAGMSLYTIHSSTQDAYTYTTRFYSGFTAELHIAKRWALLPEWIYSMQGASYKNQNLQTQLYLDYMQVPVLLQYSVSTNLDVQAGPYAGWLVDGRSETGNVKTDIKHLLRKMDMGVSGGVSYHSRKTGLGADARFNFGVTDINTNNTVAWRNMGFQAGLFYRFAK